MPLIELQGVTKVFSTEEMDTYALHDINLSINAGDYVTITGPSGCGKSTLLSIIGMLDSPSGGEYTFDSSNTATLSKSDRAVIRNTKIGLIFQAFNLLDDLSVAENVALPMTFGRMSKAERLRRASDALDRVGLSHRANHLPSQLSGGQQQRVAIARAVAHEPLLILADEPTGNLDSKNGGVVMQLLAELHAQGSTLCTVTHDSRYVDLATRQIILYDGAVVDSPTL